MVEKIILSPQLTTQQPPFKPLSPIEETIRHREQIISATNQTAKALLKSGRWDENIQEALSYLGVAARAGRVCVFQVNGIGSDSYWHLIAEWHAQNVAPLIDAHHFKELPFRNTDFERWKDLFRNNEIIKGHIQQFPASEQKLLSSLGIISTIAIPIFIDGNWWGFMELDVCDEQRDWSPGEIKALHTAVEILETFIQSKSSVGELQYQNSFLRQLIDFSPNLILVRDRQGRYVFANQMSASIYGTTVEEILGKTDKDFSTDSELLTSIQVSDHEVLDTLKEIIIPSALKKCPDGKEYWLKIVKRPIIEKDGKVNLVLVLGYDITEQIKTENELEATRQGLENLIDTRTLELEEAIENLEQENIERKRVEGQLRRQLERAAALREMDTAIALSMNLKPNLKILLDHVITKLGVDAANIMLLNPLTQTLEFTAGRGYHTPPSSARAFRVGQDCAGKVAQDLCPLFISDISESTYDFSMIDAIKAEGFVSYYGVPLIAKGNLMGVLEVMSRTSLNLLTEWVEFLSSLANQAAIAIDNATLFDGMQRANVELIHAYDDTIAGWSKALELRDQETEGHSQRVTKMTEQLALAMNISGERLVHLRRGAFLHDIGKMGIPDSILFKPGKLTAEEWVIMRKHPVYAYKLLNSIDFLRPAIDIPYGHHERWNGSGYPLGLSGSEIPLAARIFAVVDVWDALCSDRPYRNAWKREDVIAYLKKQAGEEFDPEIIKAFLRILVE